MEGFSRMCYVEYDGLIMTPAFDPAAVRSVMNYHHKPGQLFLVSYPRCGSNWLKEIISLIISKDLNDKDGFIFNYYVIEMGGVEALDMMTGPGVIKTHLPFNYLHTSPEAKYIYITRNPKDCCVSFYHITKNISLFNFKDGTFDEFFEMFVNGKVPYGDFFDHLLSWYAHKDDRNVYFLTYENLKKDTKGEVIKLAKFIGQEYHDVMNTDPNFIENVLKYSSFEYMQKTVNPFVDASFSKGFSPSEKVLKIPSLKYYHEFRAQFAPKETTVNFVRKGTVGDWENYFTPQQEERMNQWIKSKTEGSDVMKLWEGIKN